MGRRNLGATARAAASGLLPGLLLATACAGDLMAIDGGYRHRRHGYLIDAPQGGDWEEVRVEGAVLAFRWSGRGTISLQSRCGRPVADPAVMARQLVIGVKDRTLRQGGPVVVAGRSGWSQTFDTVHDGAAVRVKTVTLVEDRCIFDWTLAATGSFEAAEPDFDAWWSSFRLSAESVAVGGSE